MGEKYLYGASVHGIQNFIFQTNKLQEITGASELVEDICTTLFEKVANEKANVVGAAGNVRHIFESREKCEAVVRTFPKMVMSKAVGVSISQSVVVLKEEDSFGKKSEELELKLRSQRNTPSQSLTQGMLGVKRSNSTGLPVEDVEDQDYFDRGSYEKKKKSNAIALAKRSFFSSDEKSLADSLYYHHLPLNVERITKNNDWLAIIHADGNGIGAVVQKVANEEKEYKAFSTRLAEVTERAANIAFRAICPDFDPRNGKEVLPLRPVLLGGDDITLIIRGDLAIPYITTYMEAFEKESEEILGDLLEGVFSNGKQYLTACAGVAFIKSSYPFYYGYHLADELCNAAKKVAKNPPFRSNDNEIVPSCLMFHKVQDSYVESYDDAVKRELEIVDKKYTLQQGPYFLRSNDFPNRSIQELIDSVNKLEHTDEGVRSGIRQWLSFLHEDTEKAEQRLKQLKRTHNTDEKFQLIEALTSSVKKTGTDVESFLAYDALALYTIMNQETK